MTHPFHPLCGQTFELLTYRQNWGEDRVTYAGPDHEARSLPAAWTSVAPADPFTIVAAGRAHYRIADLLALVALIRDLRTAHRDKEEAVE